MSFVQHFILTHLNLEDVYEYVQKKFLEGTFMCAPIFLCALVSRPVCACTCTQLRGNVGADDGDVEDKWWWLLCWRKKMLMVVLMLSIYIFINNYLWWWSWCCLFTSIHKFMRCMPWINKPPLSLSDIVSCWTDRIVVVIRSIIPLLLLRQKLSPCLCERRSICQWMNQRWKGLAWFVLSYWQSGLLVFSLHFRNTSTPCPP